MIDLLRSNRLFRERVRAKETLIGVFIKTFDLGVVESIAVSTNLDFIVLNSLNDKGAGFAGDTNKVSILDRHNKTTDFELKSKEDVSGDILNYLIQNY